MAEKPLIEKPENSKKHQGLVNHCMELFDKIKASEYREKKIKRIKEAYRVYEQEEKKEYKYWQNESKLELPLLAITIDNLEPRIVAGLIGKTPIVELQEDGLSEKRPGTKILEAWFNDELLNTVGIKKIAASLGHKALLEGTVYPVVEYDEDEVMRRRYKYEQVPVIDPKTGQQAIKSTGKILLDENNAPVTEDTIQQIFTGGRVKFVPFEDMYISDDAEDWEKTDVIRHVRLSYSELYNKKDDLGYMNIGPWMLGEQMDELTEEPTIGDVKITNKKFIDCLECSVTYVQKGPDNDKDDKDVTDWTEKRYVCLITKDTKVLIRFVPLIELNFNNQHLIKRVRFFADNGKAYGSSIYEKLMSIQKGSTDLYNLMVNVAVICMIPWYLYTRASGADKAMKLEPGIGIEVDDVSQMLFPKFNQNPRAYMPFIEMFFSLWERVGAIGDIQMGMIQKGSSDVTATETMTAVQEANIKHNYQSNSLKDDFIDVIRTIWDLYYQYMPYDAMFMYQNQLMPIPRQEMERRFKFKLIGSTDASNKAIALQIAEARYKNARPDPNANHIALLEEYMSAYDEDTPPGKFVNPELSQLLMKIQQNPEIIKMIDQFIMQKQQAAQQQQQAQADRSAQIAGQSAGQAIVQGGLPNVNA